MSALRIASIAAEGPVEPPLTIIERRPRWRVIDLHEMWNYRELLVFLAWRDVKLRYRQTVLGIIWVILQPFATMLVFSLFLHRMADAQASAIPYPLFVFAGLVPWMFFSGAIHAASQSVLVSQNLVKKVYFPRLFIPMGAIGAGLVDVAATFAMLMVLLVFYGVSPGWGLLLVPLLLFGLMLTALGVGALLAALVVSYRDFRYIVHFLIQFWMFATPAIYLQGGAVSPCAAFLLKFNPAQGLIAYFRLAVTGEGTPDPLALLTSVAVSLFILVVGCLYFQWVERRFADVA